MGLPPTPTEKLIFLGMIAVTVTMFSVNTYYLTMPPSLSSSPSTKRTRLQDPQAILLPRRRDRVVAAVDESDHPIMKGQKQAQKPRPRRQRNVALEEEYKADTSKFLVKGLVGEEALQFFFGQGPNSKEPLTSTGAVFREAGISLDEATLKELPTWEIITELFGGDAPKIYGLDQCAAFRDLIPAEERNLGCSGMFNSGTNLVTQLLKNNCKIPERVAKYGTEATKEAHGIRWQASWGKHTHPKYREEHATRQAAKVNKQSILPIVTIRHPYEWMKSMCKNAYTAKWGPHREDLCPNLLDKHGVKRPLTVKYADNREDSHGSLPELWNDWYHGYLEHHPDYIKSHDLKLNSTIFPFLMVRFEDLIFHSKSVTTQICECVGGKILTNQPFQYIVDSAKDGPGHGKVSERTGMVKAWLKYGRESDISSWKQDEKKATKDLLANDLMEIFGYRHPTS